MKNEPLTPSLWFIEKGKNIMRLGDFLLLLRSASSFEEIDEYKDEITELMPKVNIMVDFDQQNHAHQYDLWEHCIQAVIGMPKNMEDEMIYLAAFLHDIGKPDCQSYDTKDGKVNMHYYGHPARSMEIVRDEIVPGLLDKGFLLTTDQIRRLLYYVEYHDDCVSLRMKHLRRHLNMGASIEEFQNLMNLQVADAKAHIMLPVILERIDICSKWAGEYANQVYKDILAGK